MEPGVTCDMSEETLHKIETRTFSALGYNHCEKAIYELKRAGLFLYLTPVTLSHFPVLLNIRYHLWAPLQLPDTRVLDGNDVIKRPLSGAHYTDAKHGVYSRDSNAQSPSFEIF
ncbi:hypothetical protein J6590_094350 [Homalodisca vitripennis]|nr:hypothetical protein J6590_094350 [Homalodisca vitripennis]